MEKTQGSTEATPAHNPRDLESALDEALDESFPASDPPAILVT